MTRTMTGERHRSAFALPFFVTKGGNGTYKEEPVQECGGGRPPGCKENAIRVQSAALPVIACESSERFDALAGAVEVEKKKEVSRPARSTCDGVGWVCQRALFSLCGVEWKADGPARSVSRK